MKPKINMIPIVAILAIVVYLADLLINLEKTSFSKTMLIKQFSIGILVIIVLIVLQYSKKYRNKN